MRVAIDLDGPCYEWDKTMRYMMRKFRGRTGLDAPSRDWLWYDQEWHDIRQEDWDWAFTEGIKLGMFRYGHMTRDTRIGLSALVEMGHELVIVTARPPEAEEDTRDWVDFFYKDIPLAGLYILGDESKASIQADVLIDDTLKNCREWTAGGHIWEDRRALLFDRPWNQTPSDWQRQKMAREGIERVDGWEGVVEWFTIRQNKSNS